MFPRYCLALFLLASTFAWSQVNTDAAADAASDTGGEAPIVTPPPVSGQAYPTAFASDAQLNTLRAGLTFATTYSNNVRGTTTPISDVIYSIWPTLAFDASTSRLHWTVQYSPGLTLYLRDEAESIELTIKSVVVQTVRPLKWVIVSDGSTDGTDGIVNKYAADYPWIELVRMPERSERHFAGKIHAFNAGYARVRDLEYEVIGSLDGDISFDQDYFPFLLGKLVEDPTLGLVGTPFKDTYIKEYDYRFVGIEHVCGACQLFRRPCFEDIGGYVPAKCGGVDLIAAIMARMKGWKTRTFIDKVCQHHRGIGTAQHGRLVARFKYGVKDYALGGHPLWEFLRASYQMTKRPFFLGGLFLGAGYVWALFQHVERPVSRELVAFRRREQMSRLRKLLTSNTIRCSEPVQHPSQAV
jgi:glycosyltransferase involved in cell wall biosynthesis